MAPGVREGNELVNSEASDRLHNISEYLPMILKIAGEHENVREQVVFAAWRVTVGAELESKCRPLQLVQKRLIIAVLNESYQHQLQDLSGQYLFKLNSLLKQPVVTFIEYKIDPDYIGLEPLSGPTPESKRSREIRTELMDEAEKIQDPALRESFLRAACSYLENSEKKDKDADH